MKTKIDRQLVKQGKNRRYSFFKCIGALALEKTLKENEVNYSGLVWGETGGEYFDNNTKKNIKLKSYYKNRNVNMMNCPWYFWNRILMFFGYKLEIEFKIT